MTQTNQTKKKPAYSVGQNVRFMIGWAWRTHKGVLWLCLAVAGLSLGLNLAQLFIAPMVLARVEQHAPLSQLLETIGLFALALVALNGLLGYVKHNTMFGRVGVRLSIINACTVKSCNPALHPTLTPGTRRSSNCWKKPRTPAPPIPIQQNTSGKR